MKFIKIIWFLFDSKHHKINGYMTSNNKNNVSDNNKIVFENIFVAITDNELNNVIVIILELSIIYLMILCNYFDNKTTLIRMPFTIDSIKEKNIPNNSISYTFIKLASFIMNYNDFYVYELHLQKED